MRGDFICLDMYNHRNFFLRETLNYETNRDRDLSSTMFNPLSYRN